MKNTKRRLQKHYRPKTNNPYRLPTYVQLVANHFNRGIPTEMYHPIFLKKRRNTMLQTIAIILIVLWLLGFVSSYTMGGFIHILLVIAVVIIILRLIQGRRL
jgi:hypothetical protein